MKNGLLLWADDEMDLLRPHILFLENKGYEVMTVTNGQDALDLCRKHTFDLVMLDENMPGLSGLETLSRIKDLAPSVPVVMVTKSEEENIMDQAIGGKIADFLIKPVNPHQILMTLKKNIHQRDILTEKTDSSYQQNFARLGMSINDARSYEEWVEVYRQLVSWELQLSEADSNMTEMLKMQKDEANTGFAKFVKRHYQDWVTATTDNRPLMSPDLFKTRIFPRLDNGEKVFLLVLDNFRYDQWRQLSVELGQGFSIDEELYLSILPTVTQYARNAIFSGLMPNKIAQMFPDLWVDEDEEEGKNLNEAPLIQTLLERYRRKDTFSYHKVNDSLAAEKLVNQFSQFQHYDLNVVVLNFIDMLSHARTESRTVRELAQDEAAYRSITLSWFRHSPVRELLKLLAESDYTVVITTDHGSIRVDKPIKVVGDRNVNTNLRYKLGRNLSYNAKEVYEIKDPAKVHLPAPNISTTYIFAMGGDFFAYPNNYNHYVSYYKDTFQHGGISMEEMLIPLVTLLPKKRK
ncbi:MAG: bifunctional response regulator/alkaline phosphatase family protein [Bacteroidaceae bacterium]|nr:bifunctional response regulator/alkaline phosphatase family protein [Bacteroidaceae bacterium]